MEQKSFTFACPHCGQHLEAESDMIGVSLDCPACGQNLEVPAIDDALGGDGVSNDGGDQVNSTAFSTPPTIADESEHEQFIQPKKAMRQMRERERCSEQPMRSKSAKTAWLSRKYVAVCAAGVILIGGLACWFALRNGDTTAEALEAFRADPPQWERGMSLVKSADQSNPELQCFIGDCYCKGCGVDADVDEAEKWYRKAAEQGFAVAQRRLGMCYEVDNPREAVKWYRKAAENGDAWAQYYLGVRYQNGRGVAQDDREAARWYLKAAEQGHVSAQFEIYSCYVNGNGVDKDDREAVKWLRRAAEQDHAEAQCMLGMYYYGGMEGVLSIDHSEAVKWYRKAADQNNAMAQFCLAGCYYLGDGVNRDAREAVKWFRKAAEQGDAKAQCTLGMIYMNGTGVEKDLVEAVKWLRKAAEQGEAKAQRTLEWLRKVAE